MVRLYIVKSELLCCSDFTDISDDFTIPKHMVNILAIRELINAMARIHTIFLSLYLLYNLYARDSMNPSLLFLKILPPS